MDDRLVRGEARSRCAEGLLHPAKSARRTRRAELRPLPTQHQDRAQGDQRRLAPVRAELLPPLPPGRAPCGSGRYVNQPSRISLRGSGKDNVMTTKNESDRERALSRRNILLAGTTIAASTIAPTSLRTAQAQAQPAPAQPGARRPNILVIFGDDIGIPQISAYTMGMMG